MGYTWHIRGNRVCIDTQAEYGAWEWKDGSEGGGLWFDRTPDGKLELIDYDGHGVLPKGVIAELREFGLVVSPDFE